MGKRKRANGMEQDVFSRFWRRQLHWRPGVVKQVKRQANKRERKEAKKALND